MRDRNIRFIIGLAVTGIVWFLAGIKEEDESVRVSPPVDGPLAWPGPGFPRLSAYRQGFTLPED